MKLHVVRHGQTELNRQRKYQGSIETDLNRRGIAQSHRAAKAMPAGLDALVSSPMRRARQTAEIISKHTGVTVHIMPQFRERAFGVFEGLSKPEIKQRFPDLWRHRPMRSLETAPPGGESVGEVLERVQQGIDELLAGHRHARVALVAHGFIARAIHGLVTRPSPKAFFNYALANGDCAVYTLTHVVNSLFQSPRCEHARETPQSTLRGTASD